MATQKCTECDKMATRTITLNNGDGETAVPLCDEHYTFFMQKVYEIVDSEQIEPK